MSSQILPGRYTAQNNEPIVVFLIGMRVNKLLSFNKWLPVASSMGPMLSDLYQHPEKGFLGGRTCLEWRGVTMIQYWRSFEDLERFAKNSDDPHLPAWKKFNELVGADGTVGIWHETYRVERSNYESIYSNMPVFGLANATQHVSVGKQSQTARRRLQQEVETTPTEPSSVEV